MSLYFWKNSFGGIGKASIVWINRVFIRLLITTIFPIIVNGLVDHFSNIPSTFYVLTWVTSIVFSSYNTWHLCVDLDQFSLLLICLYLTAILKSRQSSQFLLIFHLCSHLKVPVLTISRPQTGLFLSVPPQP